MSGDGTIPDAQGVTTVSEDRVCLSCGYLLRGLPMSGVCPECGTSVAMSLRGNLLRYEEPGYLWSLARGVSRIKMAGWCVGTLVTTAIFGSMLVGVASAAGAPSIVTTTLLIIIGLTSLGLMCAFPVLYLVGAWFVTAPNSVGESVLGDWRSITRFTAPAYVLMILFFPIGRITGLTSGTPVWAYAPLVVVLSAGFSVHAAGVRRALAVLHPRTAAYDPRRHRRLHKRLTSGPLVLGITMMMMYTVALLAKRGWSTGVTLPLTWLAGLMVLVAFLAALSLGSMIRPVAAAVAGEVAASRELAEREGVASGGGGQGVRP